MTLMIWIVGSIITLLLLAEVNRWLKTTWLFGRSPRSRHPFIWAERRPREPCPFPANDTVGRLFWSLGHRPGTDCPKCARSR